MMAPMQENNAKRRGRPAGSTSFQKIKLSTLTDNLGPNASVMVSKKWLETIGFEVAEAAPVAIDSTDVMVITSTTDEDTEEKIQFVVS